MKAIMLTFISILSTGCQTTRLVESHSDNWICSVSLYTKEIRVSNKVDVINSDDSLTLDTRHLGFPGYCGISPRSRNGGGVILDCIHESGGSFRAIHGPSIDGTLSGSIFYNTKTFSFNFTGYCKKQAE